MVCAVLGLYTLSWFWYGYEEIGNSSVEWTQLSRFQLKTESESSLRNVVLLNKNRRMENVQKHNICTKSLCVDRDPWCGNFDSRHISRL
jgi:hypothetical protein